MDGITNLISDDGFYAFENHYIMEIINKVQYDTFIMNTKNLFFNFFD